MSSIIDKAFDRAYNEAADCYNNNELEKCVEKANELLDDGAAPRFHRMKAWILLAYVLGDWHEANDCFVKADSLWLIVRRWYRVGDDAGVDESLEELRLELDELKNVLTTDEPSDYDPEAAIDAAIAAHDSEVEDATAMEEDNDPDTSEAASRKAEEQEPSIIAILRPKVQNELYVPPPRRADGPGWAEENRGETPWHPCV